MKSKFLEIGSRELRKRQSPSTCSSLPTAYFKMPSERQPDWLPSPRRPLVLWLRIPPAKTGRIDPLDHRVPERTTLSSGIGRAWSLKRHCMASTVENQSWRGAAAPFDDEPESSTRPPALAILLSGFVRVRGVACGLTQTAGNQVDSGPRSTFDRACYLEAEDRSILHDRTTFDRVPGAIKMPLGLGGKLDDRSRSRQRSASPRSPFAGTRVP